jgi:hypothetical protein
MEKISQAAVDCGDHRSIEILENFLGSPFKGHRQAKIVVFCRKTKVSHRPFQPSRLWRDVVFSPGESNPWPFPPLADQKMFGSMPRQMIKRSDDLLTIPKMVHEWGVKMTIIL